MTLQEQQEAARKELAEHPAIKFADTAIMLQAARTGTRGYTGERSLNDFVNEIVARTRQETLDAVEAGMPQERPGLYLRSDKSGATDAGWEAYNTAMLKHLKSLTK